MAELDAEIDYHRAKLAAYQRIRRAAAKMGAEWPKDATKRMLLVEEMQAAAQKIVPKSPRLRR